MLSFTIVLPFLLSFFFLTHREYWGIGPQVSHEGPLYDLSKWVLWPLPQAAPLIFQLGVGRESLQAGLYRGWRPMWLVAWSAGLEVPERLRLWLVNGRQWSPLQVTMGLKEEIASESAVDTLYLADADLSPMLVGNSGCRECRPWEDGGGYHLPLPLHR